MMSVPRFVTTMVVAVVFVVAVAAGVIVANAFPSTRVVAQVVSIATDITVSSMLFCYCV